MDFSVSLYGFAFAAFLFFIWFWNSLYRSEIWRVLRERGVIRFVQLVRRQYGFFRFVVRICVRGVSFFYMVLEFALQIGNMASTARAGSHPVRAVGEEAIWIFPFRCTDLRSRRFFFLYGSGIRFTDRKYGEYGASGESSGSCSW